jgi:hypothetical protein
MKRNLSSKWTLPTKIFNFLAAILPVVGLIAAYRELAPDPLAVKLLVVALVVLWTLFFLWINSRLKFVGVDENNLYISRLLNEKAVPLSDIEEVFLTTIGFIWVGVRFKSKTEFGSRIFFMPQIVKSFVLSFQRYHPVIEELKSIAKIS